MVNEFNGLWVVPGLIYMIWVGLQVCECKGGQDVCYAIIVTPSHLLCSVRLDLLHTDR